MIIGIADVRPGDIILCRPTQLEGELEQIAATLKLPYVHTCICCDPGEVAHAAAQRVERRKISVLVRSNQNLAVFRSLAPWSAQQVSRMQEFVDGTIQRGVQFSTQGIYNFRENRSAHDEQVVEAFFAQESLPAYSFDSDVVFCSEFVAQCCAMAGRFSDEVTGFLRPDVQSPKDVISDSAFACQFVGYLVADGRAVAGDDPFSNMQPWASFIASIQKGSSTDSQDDDAIQSFLDFQRREVANFNAFVDSESLLIRFEKEGAGCKTHGTNTANDDSSRGSYSAPN